MKLTISRESLQAPLQIIAGVVEKKQTMPVLSNILLVADESGLRLTGTNMEVELVSFIENVEIVEPGRTTVPAKKLTDICRSLDDQSRINVSLKEGRMQLTCGRSQFTLSTLPAEHYPNIEEEAGGLALTVSQGELKKILDATAFAMAQQDVRYYLNGMLFEVSPEHLRVVSTDGHRLAMATLKMPLPVGETRQVIVPRKGVLELSRLLADSEAPCTLKLGDSHIRAVVGSYVYTSKLIEGKFPDYERVIPRGGNMVMVADRLELRSMLQRAAILSHENVRGVRLQFDHNLLKVYANNPEHEEAEDSLMVEYQGEPLQIGFNVSYLTDVLGVIDDATVKITLANANSSALVESTLDDSALYVVMPMRL
jgi:DNA polymerase III subunit beta